MHEIQLSVGLFLCEERIGDRVRETQCGTGLVSCQASGNEECACRGERILAFQLTTGVSVARLETAGPRANAQTFRGAPFTTAVSPVCANLWCLVGKIAKIRRNRFQICISLHTCSVSHRSFASPNRAGMETRRGCVATRGNTRELIPLDFNSEQVIWTKDG